MNQPVRVSLRPIVMEDAEAIRAIYNWAVAHTTATMDTEPRPPEVQRVWMEKHSPDEYPALVAVGEGGGEVLGYASLSPYNLKPGYRATAEVSVYVHPDWHGRGIGNTLLAALLPEADRLGFVSLLALITSDNQASLRLHQRHGFLPAGLLHRAGYKLEQWVDVVFLERVQPG